MEVKEDSFLGTLKYGFKATISRYFELIRFIGVNYLKKTSQRLRRAQDEEAPPEEEFKPLNMMEFSEISKLIYIIPL